jgi:hypothetical protein
MVLFDYKKVIDELIVNNVIKASHVFDYIETPHEEEFAEIFQFYQSNLAHHSEYNINPSVFFFNNGLNVNAYAEKNANYKIISVNMGTVVDLMEKFKDCNDLIEDEALKEFSIFEDELDTSINNLIYQNALNFTFYHELGHLIQFSDFGDKKLYEHLDNSGGFSQRKHILEMDADEFSSLCLGTHVLQYAENMFGSELTKEQLEKLLIIGCSSAFLYILSFPSNREKIYYEKYTHPHPIIRILSIVFTIISHCIEVLTVKGINIEIKPTELVHKITNFSKVIERKLMEDKLIKNTVIKGFITTLEKKGFTIYAYIAKLQALRNEDITLAVFKRNQIITNKKVGSIYDPLDKDVI